MNNNKNEAPYSKTKSKSKLVPISMKVYNPLNQANLGGKAGNIL